MKQSYFGGDAVAWVGCSIRAGAVGWGGARFGVVHTRAQGGCAVVRAGLLERGGAPVLAGGAEEPRWAGWGVGRLGRGGRSADALRRYARAGGWVRSLRYQWGAAAGRDGEADLGRLWPQALIHSCACAHMSRHSIVVSSDK